MTRIDDARAAELQALCAAWCREGIGTEPFRAADRQLRGMAINTIIAFLADRADYKARIEELEKALEPFARLAEMHDDGSIRDSAGMIFPASPTCVRMGDLRRARDLVAQLPAPSPTDEAEFWCQLFGKALDALDECAGDDEEGWDRQGHAEDAAKALRQAMKEHEGRSTPSPPDAPASDTRGLAVEIDAEILEISVRAAYDSMLGVASYDTIKIARLREKAPWPTPHVARVTRDIRAAIEAAAPLILRRALPPAVDDEWQTRAEVAEGFLEDLAEVMGMEDAEPNQSIIDEVKVLKSLPAPDTDRKLARAVEALDWFVARSNEEEPEDYGDTGNADDARRYGADMEAWTVANMARSALIDIAAMADLTTAPAEAERETDIKPIVEALEEVVGVLEECTPGFIDGSVPYMRVDRERTEALEKGHAALDAYRKSKGE